MKPANHTDQVYGRLRALSRAHKDSKGKYFWNCICECGNRTLVRGSSLATGNTTSCGCYLKERIIKHGGWKKSSYNTWRAMKRRCLNPKDKDYYRYGALGITVCERWLNYLDFAEDMGEPSGEQTLDRINPYDNYTKENCRWADLTTQNRNLRIRKISKSGYIGVHLRGHKWYGEITSKGKKYYSYACDTVEQAAVARKELEKKYWGINGPSQ